VYVDWDKTSNEKEIMGFNVAENDLTALADIEVRKELLKKVQDRLVAEKMAIADALGEDTFSEGEVITFKKKFQKDGISYSFAAIKAGGKWYATGSNSTSINSWEELVTFLVTGNIPTTSFTKMVHVNEQEEEA